MEKYIVKIKTLTPLWTGDVNKNSEYIRETGIIGSLRWWYETLVRGLGGFACDPTGDNRCVAEKGNKKKNGENICPACELFGCTGWSGKFRLEIEEENCKPIEDIKVFSRASGGRRTCSGIMGNIVLKFIPLREIKAEEWRNLCIALVIIEKYGALGARSSQGNGVIKIIDSKLPCNIHDEDISSCFEKINNSDMESKNANLPNLKNFFSLEYKIEFNESLNKVIKHLWIKENNIGNAKINLKQYKFLPIAFHIRDTIRRVIVDNNLRHDLFGVLGRGSKIFVSHGWLGDETQNRNTNNGSTSNENTNNGSINNKAVFFRIFGFVPDKEEIIEKIKTELTNESLKEKLFNIDENGSNDYSNLIKPLKSVRKI